MVRLKLWQWIALATPIASIVIFLLIAAGRQIHEWGINWIWGAFTLIFVGWRWLLVKWTRPEFDRVETVLARMNEELESPIGETTAIPSGDAATKAEAAFQKILKDSQNDPAIWEDWPKFWQRCQESIVAIARVYHPEVKYPLLNIYIPQAYTLLKGTVNDLERWMQQLSPILNQATVGQAYHAYEVYRKVEPSANKLFQVWNWSQWVLNPAAALAKQASQTSSNRATQELFANLNRLLREAALRNLCQQAIALYSSTTLSTEKFLPATATIPETNTKTLGEILSEAESVEKIEQKPVNILLVGRTGSGKSSLINTLFQAEKAEVDMLPSTERIQNYHWQSVTGETLMLWDTPGYEQVKRSDLRDRVLEYTQEADLVLLVTPALDPALQMDVDFLKSMRVELADLPVIAVLTQVDRLRPLREWNPPYDWQWGDRPKEIAIREATEYRVEIFGELCDLVLPLVTDDIKTGRTAWGADNLSLALIEAIDPAKQIRLARFLRDLEARSVAAAKIIDRYTFQMTTTQGLTAMLKSPILQFLSTLSTGSPTLAYVLAEQIPVEQLPIVLGKLQMAYDLFSLLNSEDGKNFDLLSLWPLLLDNSSSTARNAWAFGHALVEYWTKNLTVEQLRERFDYYLKLERST